MEDQLIIEPTLAKSTINFKPDEPTYSTSKDYQRTLAQLLGYNSVDEITDLLRVDGNGNLLVSSEGVASTELFPTTVTITSSVSNIISVNSSRKGLVIKNLSGATIYISSSDSVNISTGYPIETGLSFSLDNFVGALYGIVSGADVSISVMELE